MSRTDAASRLISAPHNKVFSALVDPDALRIWLPPDGMKGRFERFDPPPDGSYRLVLSYVDATASSGKATADSDIVEARFVDLVPGERVVQAIDFVSDDPAFAGTMTMTWKVSPTDGATQVDVIAVDVPDGISPADHQKGMASSLDNLARYVESDEAGLQPSVLFLCVHNAGRSQMAAGWLRHLAGESVDILSGGSEPADEVNEAAVEAMAERGVDISQATPQRWTDDALRAADVVVTMGCGDTCPVYPGKRYLDWEVDDPAGKRVEEVRVIRDDIERRVRELMAELKIPAVV